MSEKEILEKLVEIHNIYALPRLVQHMKPYDYAIVEYEKLVYELKSELSKYKEFGDWFKGKEIIDKYFNNSNLD